jgi:isochorismate synthase
LKSQIKTSVKSIGETLNVCLENNLTFVAYRLPNEVEQLLMVQKIPGVQELANLSELTKMKGFVVAPFINSQNNPTFIIQPDFYFVNDVPNLEFDELITIKHPEKNSRINTPPYVVTKSEYIHQIESIKEAIHQKRIEKVVLSRIKTEEGNYKKHVPELFSQLCKLFPNAFVYVFKTQDYLWMGATPEPLAVLKNNVFQTSSVAGTKENIEKFRSLENWGSKEKQEQHYVSDHIHKVLRMNNWENIAHNGPYVDKAGNVLHLRTDFTSRTNVINGNVGSLINYLHPTPAICGSPTNDALAIIALIEKHDREYYGGFLGPVGMKNPIELFVNLRCMQIMNSRLLLYTGGGLTSDSNPVDEWYETEIKAGTLLSVIKKLT